MTIPLNDMNYYSQRVYNLDPLKKLKNRPDVGNDGIASSGESYYILDISGNGTYGKKKQYGVPNHMQAMTVAPVKDGVVDYSQLTIAYAGADKESLYTKPVEKLNEQLKPLNQLKEELADFDKAFDKSIKQRIADDQELAGEFGL